jgi:hypothetical protein
MRCSCKCRPYAHHISLSFAFIPVRCLYDLSYVVCSSCHPFSQTSVVESHDWQENRWICISSGSCPPAKPAKYTLCFIILGS